MIIKLSRSLLYSITTFVCTWVLNLSHFLKSFKLVQFKFFYYFAFIFWIMSTCPVFKVIEKHNYFIYLYLWVYKTFINYYYTHKMSEININISYLLVTVVSWLNIQLYVYECKLSFKPQFEIIKYLHINLLKLFFFFF